MDLLLQLHPYFSQEPGMILNFINGSRYQVVSPGKPM